MLGLYAVYFAASVVAVVLLVALNGPPKEAVHVGRLVVLIAGAGHFGGALAGRWLKFEIYPSQEDLRPFDWVLWLSDLLFAGAVGAVATAWALAPHNAPTLVAANGVVAASQAVCFLKSKRLLSIST